MSQYQAVTVPGWEGWVFDPQGYLVDPAGNKFEPRDLAVSFWARQHWQEAAGSSPSQLGFLKRHLKHLVAEAQAQARPSFVVRIERETPDGSELVQSLRLGG